MAAARSTKLLEGTPINLDTITGKEGIIILPTDEDNLVGQRTYRFDLETKKYEYKPNPTCTVIRTEDKPLLKTLLVFARDKTHASQEQSISGTLSVVAPAGVGVSAGGSSSESGDNYSISGYIMIAKTIQIQSFVAITPDSLPLDETYPTHYVSSIEFGAYLAIDFTVSGITRKLANELNLSAGDTKLSRLALTIASRSDTRATTTLGSAYIQGFADSPPARESKPEDREGAKSGEAKSGEVKSEQKSDWHEYISSLQTWAHSAEVSTPIPIRARLLPLLGYHKVVKSYYRHLALKTELKDPTLAVPSNCVTKYDLNIFIKINGKNLTLKGETFTLSSEPNVVFRIIPVSNSTMIRLSFDRFIMAVYHTYSRKLIGYVKAVPGWFGYNLKLTKENFFALNAEEKLYCQWMVGSTKNIGGAAATDEKYTAEEGSGSGAAAAGTDGAAAGAGEPTPKVDTSLMCYDQGYFVRVVRPGDNRLIGLTANGSLSKKRHKHFPVSFHIQYPRNSHARSYATPLKDIGRDPGFIQTAEENRKLEGDVTYQAPAAGE